ncbi:MAG TPA: LPS export ABC transporter periplasmic protein LptC [Alphaproteobacteria bacterium]|nr:LPS export ABC transporter periplasmic protein LptC [Alphaproteobacteria bacterium]
MRQRLALMLLIAAVALTGLLLWGVKDNRTLRLEAPVASKKPLNQSVSATNVNTSTDTEKPQYNGEDNKGRKWQLNADRATQSGTVSDSVVGLQTATGWWQNGSTTLVGQADTGEYSPGDAKLSLKGNVVMETSDTVIHTPALKADMTTQQISGTSGVSLTHALATQNLKVQAQQFTVDPATKKVTLRGNVHARLEPK